MKTEAGGRALQPLTGSARSPRKLGAARKNSLGEPLEGMWLCHSRLQTSRLQNCECNFCCF